MSLLSTIHNQRQMLTCHLQGAKEAQEQAQAAVREGEEAVTQVQKEYRGAVAEVEKLVEERQHWQQAWDEERQRMEADKAALAASMDVSHPTLLCAAVRLYHPAPHGHRLFLDICLQTVWPASCIGVFWLPHSELLCLLCWCVTIEMGRH